MSSKFKKSDEPMGPLTYCFSGESCFMRRRKIRAVTAQEIARLDRLAIGKYKISSLVLMENAGAAVAQAVSRLRRGRASFRVCVVCGTGHNGGDGFVAARHLMNAGVKVVVFVVGNKASLKADALTNYRILKVSGCPVRFVRSLNEEFRLAVRSSDVIVDAVLGVGLSRKISGLLGDILQFLNHSHKTIVAVDVPTGLNAATGEVQGICLKAAVTVTMTRPKKGFFLKEGRKVVGKIIVADIGIPVSLVKRVLR